MDVQFHCVIEKASVEGEKIVFFLNVSLSLEPCDNMGTITLFFFFFFLI